MSITIGDRLPDGKFMQMGENGPEPVSVSDFFAGKTVVVFALPGAFTPTCSAKHLPGFLDKVSDFKAKAVDDIVCFSVNDAFVMQAWAKDQNVNGQLHMFADGAATYTKTLGLELDLIEIGLGIRSQRFAMVVKDGVVTHLEIDQGGVFEKTSADYILSLLS